MLLVLLPALLLLGLVLPRLAGVLLVLLLLVVLLILVLGILLRLLLLVLLLLILLGSLVLLLLLLLLVVVASGLVLFLVLLVLLVLLILLLVVFVLLLLVFLFLVFGRFFEEFFEAGLEVVPVGGFGVGVLLARCVDGGEGVADGFFGDGLLRGLDGFAVSERGAGKIGEVGRGEGVERGEFADERGERLGGVFGGGGGDGGGRGASRHEIGGGRGGKG